MRIQHVLVSLALYTSRMTDNLVRIDISRVGVGYIRHTLPHIRPIIEMAGVGITRGDTRMGHKVPLAIILDKGNGYIDTTFVRRFGI